MKEIHNTKLPSNRTPKRSASDKSEKKAEKKVEKTDTKPVILEIPEVLSPSGRLPREAKTTKPMKEKNESDFTDSEDESGTD